MKIPSRFKNVARKLMTKGIFNFILRSKDRSQIYLTGKVKGTVPSGCSSKTTVGNTMR